VPAGATVEGQLAAFQNKVEIAQIDDADSGNSGVQGLKFTKPATGSTATLTFKFTGIPVDGTDFVLGESQNAFTANANGGTGKFTASAVVVRFLGEGADTCDRGFRQCG